MIVGRLIGVVLVALVGLAGCAVTAGRGAGDAVRPAGAAPVMVDPSQIFNDVSQSP